MLPQIIEDRPIDFALSATPLQLPRGGAFRDYEQPGTVTFFLTAPDKTTAHVTGDFNGWSTLATPMETDGRGTFWVTVPLRGATHYRFVVAQDEAGQQRVAVADPYAREIRWDQAGPKAFLGDDPPYVWHDQAWQRPPLRELAIYELGVRDFSGTKRQWQDQYGDFDGARARLDHLARLGVNAIELMPISEFPGDSSWGYNPVFYMAPKWLYGRPAQFKALVDEAHQRGIAVILDMVFNHAWADHPYHRMYPPLYSSDGKPLPDLNPFFHHPENGHANSWGGVDWDHGSPYTLAYMQDVVRFWLEEYRVDGFRFDWVGGVEWDPDTAAAGRLRSLLRYRANRARRPRDRADLLSDRRILADFRRAPRQDRGPAGPRNRHRRGVERRIPSYAGALPDPDLAVGAPEFAVRPGRLSPGRVSRAPTR